MPRPLLRLLLLLSLAAGIGCGASAFKAAHEKDTAEAWRTFLRDHPDDPNADAARLALSEKEFEEAAAQHSLLGYKRFLEAWPDAPKAPAARALLEGLRFNAARERDTANAWRQFLRDHPDGAHREEAEKLLAEASFREAGTKADTEELARLLKEHPDDPRRLELQARLDSKAFEDARAAGAFALFDYLRDFPAGAHRTEAQAVLFGLRIQGLLFSGLVDRAKAEAEKSPLAAKVEGLADRIRDAEATAKVLAAADPAVQRAQARYYLRSIADLTRALRAPDPLDRWQAAEELGQHVSVEVIDPLVDAIRTARNALIRQRAVQSLLQVVTALPDRVADYEIASRVEALRPTAGSPEAHTVLAVLLDVSGRLEAAAADYQRAWDVAQPDPMILRRWVDIRQKRRQPFSAAVAARQLALWAQGKARLHAPAPEAPRVAVTDVRELCAAARNARFAVDAIRAARGQVTEFPEDIDRFLITATEAMRLAEARLKDAELALRGQDPNARTCGDSRVRERVEAAVLQRAEAVRTLLGRPPSESTRRVLAAVGAHDPAPEVRSLAVRVAAGGPP